MCLKLFIEEGATVRLPPIPLPHTSLGKSLTLILALKALNIFLHILSHDGQNHRIYFPMAFILILEISLLLA
jgi:hypothetical protein